eukprot:CAMPEP_0197386788 /NCGR_PEP_ID=MMETSP1165-20131217/90_1 /TAXON_ID=284809 /ORGANISM="Chrysocystis fragilis, Strain CCMP3189" /LENGTH=72 /DNA_ID=CAMNT_0042912047 /DNA_START=54 /DNA_END=270 /DNA_ORIENTATION=+
MTATKRVARRERRPTVTPPPPSAGGKGNWARLEDDVRTLAVLLMELIDDGELYDLCPVEVVVRRLKKLEFLR